MWWNQWLPLAPYAASAAAVTVALLLFLSLKRDLDRAMRQERQRVDSLLENLRQPATPPPAAPAESPPAALLLRPGMNLDRRLQVLKLLRRGETPARIAGSLGIPRAEIELLVRVQALAARGPDS